MTFSIDLLKEALSGLEFTLVEERDGVRINIKPHDIIKAASSLKNMGYDNAEAIVAIDVPEEQTIRLVYVVSSYEKSLPTIFLTVDLPREEAKIKSITSVWLGLEYQEREIHDLFGVVFEDNPDQRPLIVDYELVEMKVMRRDFRIEY